jgi:CRISPR type I-E-associated protein CasB/Cse2
MSEKDEWQSRFINRLRELTGQNTTDPAAAKKPDRATLAELRRGLAVGLDRVLYRAGWLFSGVPEGALEDALLVAGLFATHQQHEPGVSLGDAFRELNSRTDSDSDEKRFAVLLDTMKEDLPGRLRQAVALLKAKEIGLDWERLLTDLQRWTWSSRQVQWAWARAFWKDQGESDPEETTPTSETSVS